MRNEVGRVRWLAALAAVFLSIGGCTFPLPGGKSGNNTNISVPSPTPTPSPSPTPTQQFAASSPSFHIGEVGVGYSPVGVTAMGGVQPYHYTLSGGALPPGLNLGTDGSVAGMPTSAGTFSFAIEVTDSGEGKAPVTGSITIASPLSAALIPACAKYCNVELGCTNACGNFGQQSGGVGPFSYALTQGQLPSGTSLNALSLTGTFTGLTGYLQFSVQVTDSLGATATVSPTFWMYAHVAMSNGTCYSTYYPFPCSAKLPFSGGTPGTAFSVTVQSASGQFCTRGVTGGWNCNPTTSPPPMFSATVGQGVVNVNVPGQPNNPFEYSGTVVLRLSNQDTCGPGAKCSATANVQVTFAGG